MWIIGDRAPGTPEFLGVLSHELVHLAGHILRNEGAACDPLGEQLSTLVGELMEAVLRRAKDGSLGPDLDEDDLPDVEDDSDDPFIRGGEPVSYPSP